MIDLLGRAAEGAYEMEGGGIGGYADPEPLDRQLWVEAAAARTVLVDAAAGGIALVEAPVGDHIAPAHYGRVALDIDQKIEKYDHHVPVRHHFVVDVGIGHIAVTAVVNS